MSGLTLKPTAFVMNILAFFLLNFQTMITSGKFELKIMVFTN